MSLQSPESTSFPFLSLPLEIRNMIYDYLFHKPTPITLSRYKNKSSRIALPMNFLTTNNQIHLEACSALYHRNTLIIDYSSHHNEVWPICKIDIDTPNSIKLRSGCVISFSRSERRIYPHVLHRFKTLGLNVPCYNYSRANNLQGINIAKALNALRSSPLVIAATAESMEAPRSLPLPASVPANLTSQCKFLVLELLFWKFSERVYADRQIPGVPAQMQEFLLKHSILQLAALLAHDLNRQLVIEGPFSKDFMVWCNKIASGRSTDEGQTTTP